MAPETRWLKWDGVYDLAGMCNQPLTPLDSASEQVKAIKERLYLLGFDCGTLDNNLNDETKKALRTFNGYWNHPTIHRLIDPVVLPLDDKYLIAGHLDNLGQLVEAKTVLPADVPPLAPPYYDKMTIDCLKEIEDKGQIIKKLAPAGVTKFFINLSRKTKGGSGYSTTINTTKPLAVKVVSTPKSFSPFSEFAAIKIEISGFKDVKSLLIRIYRNFDSTKDETAIPGDKLIYQEVLDYEGIQALTEKGPQNNLGKHHEAKAFIMNQEVGGGFSGSFRQFLGVAYERLHAPYKIKVWVSTVDKFFEKYAFSSNAKEPSSRSVLKKEEANLHYLDDQKREKVRRGRKESLTFQESLRDTSYRNEPDVNHLDTVHDKSNIVKTDSSESMELLLNWGELAKSNLALNQSRLWTEKDEHQINLMEEPCPVPHNARFLLDNLIQEELLPKIFSQDPVGTYMELRGRLDSPDGENFQFAEMSELFANIERHINIIKRRLCCGQWKHLESPIKDDVLSFIDTKILPEIGRLKGATYPYDESVLFCEKFISFFSYIVHKAVVQYELDFFTNFDLQKADQPPFGKQPPLPGTISTDKYDSYASWLRDRRNQIDGCRSTAGSEYGITTGHKFHTNIDSAEKAFVATSFSDTYPLLKNEIKTFMDYKTRQIGKAVLLPSYNPLDAYYFVKIRAVPMYVIGMLDMQYLNADGIRQIPVGFFEHDMFHVATPGPGTQQWKTLYKRLCEVIDASQSTPNPLTEQQVYQKWQDNVTIIKQRINSHSGDRQKTLGFLLFWLLHEPKSGDREEWITWLESQGLSKAAADKQYKDFPHPAMPEPTLMTNRLLHGFEMSLRNLRREDATDFFGDYSHPFMPNLDWATTIYAFLASQLEDLP
jgi:hypothetical protein